MKLNLLIIEAVKVKIQNNTYFFPVNVCVPCNGGRTYQRAIRPPQMGSNWAVADPELRTT